MKVNHARFKANAVAENRRSHGPQEFADVVARHRPQIFRFLLASLRDIDLAETLTQECFLKAHRSWPKFRHDANAITWLTRIAINLQKDLWRNRRSQFWRQMRVASVDPDEACEWLPSRESSPEEQVAAKEQLRQVWKAVGRLSERQRTVFLLRVVEDHDLSTIVDVTGMCHGTVKAHLSRALGRVRSEVIRKSRFRAG